MYKYRLHCVTDVSSGSVRPNPWAAAAATAARLAFVSSQNLRHLASARY